MGVAELQASPWPSDLRAAVMLSGGEVGGHTGIYFVQEDGLLALLHLAFHHDLRCEQREPERWVVPKIPEERLRIVAARCEQLAEEHRDGKVGYGFSFKSASIADGRRFVIDSQEAGLTCATAVMLIFRDAGIELLDTETWFSLDADRQKEDKDKQKSLVTILEKRFADMKRKNRPPWDKEQMSKITNLNVHIQKLKREIGSARFRAEEVAAASGLGGHPVAFADAAPEGARLLALIKSGP